MSIQNDNRGVVADEQQYEQGLDQLDDDNARLLADNGGARLRRPLKPIKDADHDQVTTYSNV